MNWKKKWRQIENKYPKAYALWMQFDSPEVKICITYRDLYDFFDEQILFIEVTPKIQYTRDVDEDYRNPHYHIDEWGYEINDNSFALAMDFGFESRKESEEEAFTKAFEILEEKLNND